MDGPYGSHQWMKLAKEEEEREAKWHSHLVFKTTNIMRIHLNVREGNTSITNWLSTSVYVTTNEFLVFQKGRIRQRTKIESDCD